MKYVSYERDGLVYPAVLVSQTVYPLAQFGYSHSTLEAFIADSDGSEHARIRRLLPGAVGIDAASVRLVAPIPEPLQQAIIMENNYCQSAEEAALKRQAAAQGKLLPTYYYKKATCVTTDGGTIPRYEGFLEQLDVQAELCAVLGRAVTHCETPADARRHLFGYVVINNVIAHDLTLRHRRPYISTGLDGFFPMSPYIVSADEFPEGHRFHIRSYVNGALCQEGTTDQRVFSEEYAIADLSRAGVLFGATLLSTGTPVGSLRDKGLPFLKSGDVVRCEIDGVGSVTSTIR